MKYTAAGNAYGPDFNPRGVRPVTDTLVVHCSAAPNLPHLTAEQIVDYHMSKWRSCGYHDIIQYDGTIVSTLHGEAIGAHVGDVTAELGHVGWNYRSRGVCLMGGTDRKYNPEDNFTDAQVSALIGHLYLMVQRYGDGSGYTGGLNIWGHNYLIDTYGSNYDNPATPWNEGAKACPVISMDNRVLPMLRDYTEERRTIPTISATPTARAGEEDESNKRTYTFACWLRDKWGGLFD